LVRCADNDCTGRWIRQQLAIAEPQFWSQRSTTGKEEDKTFNLDLPGFTFLSFDGLQDGEDIKAEFKLRLASAEALLTATEKQEIILVSQQLFDRCILLVSELDRKIWRDKVRSWSWPIATWVSVLVVSLAMLRYFWRFAGVILV
jgi:hypothetical protein